MNMIETPSPNFDTRSLPVSLIVLHYTGMESAQAAIDRLARGSKAKLTPDRAAYFTHPDWVAAPGRAPPSSLWKADIPTPQGLADTAAWYRSADLL